MSPDRTSPVPAGSYPIIFTVVCLSGRSNCLATHRRLTGLTELTGLRLFHAFKRRDLGDNYLDTHRIRLFYVQSASRLG